MPKVRDDLPTASGIYQIKNVVNGKIYVGSAANIRKRWVIHKTLLRRGRHHSRHLQSAWNKYGGSAFVVSILLICRRGEATPEEFLATLVNNEQIYLDDLKPYLREIGYNVSPTASSSLGIKRSDETRAKLSKSHKGKKFSEDRRVSLALARKGLMKRKEIRAKISASLKGIKRSVEFRQRQSERQKNDPKMTEYANKRWDAYRKRKEAIVIIEDNDFTPIALEG